MVFRSTAWVRSLATALGTVLVQISISVTPGHSLELGLPLQCQLGETCWVVNYVDLDPGKGFKDHACTSFGYDGHKGTDFAIRDLKVMAAGVPVIAADGGVVRGVRDGMADVDVSETGRANINGRECGNGVVIAHEGGWETQYCHMRKDSVRVKKGTRVTRGQQLGLVGHSGLAQFPHVHISVRQGKTVVDPFTANSPGQGCGKGKESLWRPDVADQLKSPPGAIFNAGFAARSPSAKAVRAGLYRDDVLSRQAPVLVLWADMYWPLVGDQLRMRIFGPDGKIMFEHKKNIPKTQARRFFFAGKKRKPLFWPAGAYRGEITLLRKNSTGQVRTFSEVRRVTLK